MVVIGTLTSRDKGEHSVDLAAQALVVIELGETEKGPRDVSLHEPFEVAWTDTFGELALQTGDPGQTEREVLHPHYLEIY